MFKALKKFFDKTLPLSGDKTKLGAWILGISAIKDILPPEIIGAVADAVTAAPVNYGGLALLLIGLLHKSLKKKYGKDA